MISSRRWISFRASAVDKPDGNLGKGDEVFIQRLIKITAYILRNIEFLGLSLSTIEWGFQIKSPVLIASAKRIFMSAELKLVTSVNHFKKTTI